MQDAEFQLLVAACGAAVTNQSIEVLPSGIRWERLLALAARHRVQALCWSGLQQFADAMPGEAAMTLRSHAREIVMANLRSAAECRRLRDLFASAEVPLLFVKGVTLAAIAYRNPYLKMGVDIDLLVEPARLAYAAHVLRLAGFARVTPSGASDRALIRWHATHKESVWIRAAQGFQVDLHTRLADHPDMLSGLTASSPSQMVPIDAVTCLPTLTEDELFSYLCVHGASSAWFRLKWVTDLAGLLRGKGAQELARLYERSQQLGAGRAAAQALLLADQLSSIDLGVEFRRRLEADPVTRWLVHLARRQLLNPVEPTERFLGTATIHLSQLGLQPGWRFAFSEAARQFREITGTSSFRAGSRETSPNDQVAY